MSKFKKNESVKVNGHDGVVKCYYSQNMVEVRLATGIVCVDEGDIQTEKKVEINSTSKLIISGSCPECYKGAGQYHEVCCVLGKKQKSSKN